MAELVISALRCPAPLSHHAARFGEWLPLQKLNGWGLCLLDHSRRACVNCVAGGSTRRYEVPDGGGLSAEGRARREKLRLQAAQMFEQDVDPVQVARLLRVSTKSAYQWRRRWRAEARPRWRPGAQAGRYAGSMSSSWPGCVLRWMRAGRIGWDEDQRWTLARAAALIAGCSTCATRCAACRTCCTDRVQPQVPAHRARSAMRRDRRWRAVTGRRYEASGGDRSVDLLRGRGRAEPAPPKARTWARAGTPVVRCAARARGGYRSRGWCACGRRAGPPVLRVRIHRGRKGERRSMSEADTLA